MAVSENAGDDPKTKKTSLDQGEHYEGHSTAENDVEKRDIEILRRAATEDETNFVTLKSWIVVWVC